MHQKYKRLYLVSAVLVSRAGYRWQLFQNKLQRQFFNTNVAKNIDSYWVDLYNVDYKDGANTSLEIIDN